MSSSTVNSKKIISSNNGPYEILDPRNSVQLSANYEDSVLQSQSWSDSKIKNEISSFIAEFSYLDVKDENRPSKKNRPRISLQTYQVYPAQFDYNNPKTGFYFNKNRSTRKMKKSIGRKDGEPPHLYIQNEDQTNLHFFRQPSINGEREISHVLSPRYNKHDKYVTIQERPTSNLRSRSPSARRLSYRGKKYRSRTPSKSLSMSQSKGASSKIKHKPRESSRNKSKPRMVIRHMKYPYSRSKRRMRPQLTESRIKHIPLRYGRKKSRRRRIMMPYHQVVKTPIASPSVVTLYPSHRIKEELLLPHNQYLEDSYISCKCNRCQKKKRRKKSKRHRVSPIRGSSSITSPSTITHYPNNRITREEHILPYDKEFFVDSHNSCKCYQCMKKHKALIKMSAKKQYPNNKKLKTCFDSIKYPDCCYEKEADLWELTRCTNQADIEYASSVQFKFNSYCQYFDPEITQYFHSILDQASCV